ncbi:MAG: DUF3089 domain-containing protein [Chitinophagaceae bacterium]|nr:DUF3089 domain-containing protein [Chitinophagaceae bacterium]
MQRNFLLVLIAIYFLQSCAPRYSPYTANYPLADGVQSVYADHNYWAAHPGKHDPSDSLPEPIRSFYRYDSTVDVFFLHPTTFTQKNQSSWNAAMNDPGLNAKTDYSTILYQASAFNEYRVFAPRYRQAHLRSYYSAGKVASNAFDTAYEDVRNAFIYYLANYNNNHPIIIASHSQGTTHAMRLLKEFFENKPLSNKLVAAYLIGMYIPNTYFTTLRTCKDPVQVGCVCAWRSYQSGYIPSFVKKEIETGLVVNPLTWTTEETPALKNKNKGAVLRNFNKVYYHVADARINKGILWISKPEFPGSFFLRMKNYHVADINFFYLNIRENLRQRVDAFKIRD